LVSKLKTLPLLPDIACLWYLSWYFSFN